MWRETLMTCADLAQPRWVPNDWEDVSPKFLWYASRGFEVEPPVAGWYARHQTASALAADDWDRFADPRETTYTKYVMLQRSREAFADGILRMMGERQYDALLPAAWMATLERLLPVMRYPAHAMQMLAAYAGQMAPGGRIVIACAMQAADEVRRIQRTVERTVQLRHTHPRFGEHARRLWERGPAWQPLREALDSA